MPDTTAILVAAALLLLLYLAPVGSGSTTSQGAPATATPPTSPGGTTGAVQPSTRPDYIPGVNCAAGSKPDPSGTTCVPLCPPGFSSYNPNTGKIATTEADCWRITV